MMTQSLKGSRKRVRGSRDEEISDLPLSKRIHNLRINNGNCCSLDGLGHQKHPQVEAEECLENGEQWVPQEAGTSGMNGTSTEVQQQQQQNFGQNEGIHERLTAQAQHSQQYLENNVEVNNNPDPWVNGHVIPRYSPDLDASANPFYYENNKLLYDLYIERMQRCGMI